jgi:hypothetical protein
MDFLNGSTRQNGLIGFKDPFKKDKVNSITFSRYSWNSVWQGTVGFQNGKTSGKQEFENEDLFLLVKEVENFIASL